VAPLFFGALQSFAAKNSSEGKRKKREFYARPPAGRDRDRGPFYWKKVQASFYPHNAMKVDVRLDTSTFTYKVPITIYASLHLLNE